MTLNVLIGNLGKRKQQSFKTANQMMDYNKQALPEGRTREYLKESRSAEHQSSPERSSHLLVWAPAPQCCQFFPLSWDNDNLKAI
ncbi:unnamed protein product [Caenorhabditis nigoni]